jgi:hypothetical protein
MMIEDLTLPAPSPSEMVQRFCDALRRLGRGSLVDKPTQAVAQMFLNDPNFTNQVQEIYDYIGDRTQDRHLAKIRVVCKRHMAKLEQEAEQRRLDDEQRAVEQNPAWGRF